MRAPATRPPRFLLREHRSTSAGGTDNRQDLHHMRPGAQALRRQDETYPASLPCYDPVPYVAQTRARGS